MKRQFSLLLMFLKKSASPLALIHRRLKHPQENQKSSSEFESSRGTINPNGTETEMLHRTPAEMESAQFAAPNKQDQIDFIVKRCETDEHLALKLQTQAEPSSLTKTLFKQIPSSE